MAAVAERPPRRLAMLLEIAVAVTAALLLARYRPGDLGFLRCTFHELTGLHCPGCGATRAAWLLVHGQPLLAMRYHLLLVLAAPWIGWLWLRHLADLWRGGPPRRVMPPAKAWMGYGVVVLLLAFWILRNVPAYPFDLLAPPGPLPG